MGYIFHSRLNNEGEQQVLYKFSYQAKPIIISTGIHVKKKNFNKIKGESKSRLAKIESIILDSISEAKNRVPPFSNEELKRIIENRIDGRQVDNGEVRLKLREAWENRISYFERAKKFDSKRHNLDSMRVVLEILPNIYVDQITTKQIESLRDELLIGRAAASVAGYMRDLRATIISVVGRVNSPFIGVSFPKGVKKKNIAMNWDEFQLFRNVPLKYKSQELVRDMFVFRYICLGMRFKDQVYLTHDNIINGRLSYITHKTTKPFEFNLPQECLDIIERWSGSKYLFPIMKDLKPEQQNFLLKDTISAHDKVLKKIAKYAGINKKLGTHSARHTYAYIHQDKGLKFIQDSFDHETIKTTQGYVESLSNQDSLIEQTRK